MKKRIAWLLVLVVALSVMAGCGGGTAPASSAADQNTTSAAPSSTSEDVAPAANVDSDGWPAIGSADAPVPVKIVIKDVLPTEEDVIAMAETIETKMASHGQYVDLEFIEPPAGTYGEALPLAVRTGEMEADIIYFQGGDLVIAQEGLLEDLTPYIQNSTYIKELMSPANATRTENYPYLLWLAPARVQIPVMRADWASQLESYEKLLADPTVDNYYNLFKEMKDKGLVEFAITADDANNQGEGNMTRLNSIFNQAFGVTATIVQQDGKWVFSRATQAEKDKLEFYAKLYAEGLLDPEYLTNTWDVLEQKFYEGRAGIIAGGVGATTQIYANKMSSTQGTDLVVLPPAKGVGFAYRAIDVTREDRGLAINIDSQNKDAAWAVLEFMASPEGRIIDKCGIEGKHHNIENGQIVFTEAFPEWWSRFWETTNNFASDPPLAQPIYVESAQASLDMANQYYAEDVNVLIPDELAPQWDAMKTLYDEYSADVIRGIQPISSFDQFVQDWNAAGGDAFSEYLATVLN